MTSCNGNAVVLVLVMGCVRSMFRLEISAGDAKIFNGRPRGDDNEIAAFLDIAGRFLAGCQTPYQEMGATGGVVAMPITNDTYRISARGNGYTDPTVIQDYSLLKAAEVTLQSGNSHFLILGNQDATKRDFGQTPGTFQTNVYGNTAFTTYNPGVTYDVVKPGQDLLVQVGKVLPGQQPPAGAFPAQQVYDNISPRVLRPKKK